MGYTLLMKRLKIAGLASAIVLTGTIAGVMATTNNPKPTGADTSPITGTLSNHETRIKNAENNIKVLQSATGTTDSPDNTTITPPVASGSAQTNNVSFDEITTATVTVASYREIPVSNGRDCEYTYTDGTTYRFNWERTNPQGSWVTNGDGTGGHWVATVQREGKCDDSVIGSTK